MKLKPTYFFLFFILISCFSAQAQNAEKGIYKQIKTVSGKIKQPADKNDKKITFLNTESILPEPGVEIMQIMILRHQKVNLQKQSNYAYKEAIGYFEAYDTAQIFPLDFIPVHLEIDEIDTIYTSTLPRAIETAKAIFGNSIPRSEYEIFGEYQKLIPPIPVARLPLGFWKVLSTTGWVLGLTNPAGETFKQGRQRAKVAGKILEVNAGAYGKTILSGHGFINHYIKKYLEKNGWKMVIDGKNKNLGVTLFVKVKP